MKDGLILLLSATGMAALAWMFWAAMGDMGFNVVALLALVVLTVDNIRLRRRLRTTAPK